MGNLTTNFARREFACRDACGFDSIDMRIVNIAQALRTRLGIAVRVTSGCRCRKRNSQVGGSKTSTHMAGFACDLASNVGSQKMFETLRQLYNEGLIPDLGYCLRYIRKNIVHIDCGPKRGNLFATTN